MLGWGATAEPWNIDFCPWDSEIQENIFQAQCLVDLTKRCAVTCNKYSSNEDDIFPIFDDKNVNKGLIFVFNVYIKLLTKLSLSWGFIKNAAFFQHFLDIDWLIERRR